MRARVSLFTFISIIVAMIGIIVISTTVIKAGNRSDAPSAVKYYTSIEVKSGDTLSSIADSYMSAGYSSTDEYINEVMKMNHLTSTTIKAGEYLAIPYYSYE